MRMYNLNQDDIRTSPNMVANMITLNSHKLYALLDPGAAYFFISCRFDSKINVPRSKLKLGLVVSTPLKEIVDINDVYKGCVMTCTTSDDKSCFID